MQNDLKTASRAAHKLKGIALNLNLTSLSESTIEHTKMLHSGRSNKIMVSLLQNTKKTYELVLESVNALINR